MSKFDGSSEKRKEGSDSASFKGKRHPFLDRRVDWKAIDRARHRIVDAGLDDVDEIPSEIPLEITGMDQRQKRIEACVAAVKQLSTNPDMWYRIRDYLVDEYQEGGPKRKKAKTALMGFVAAVNKRLGASGSIRVDPIIGLLARNVAKTEGVARPELSVHVTVNHCGGVMGPIGVCFQKKR